ncbi:unnamed protein product [Closterium sp. Yama58-4]|nr:unnamed protein product [Closterium sp. Yama58-4]
MWGSSHRLTEAFGFTPPTSCAALPSSPPLPAATTTNTTSTPRSYLANPFALPFSSPFSLGFSPTLVPATPVDPAPLTVSPLNLSATAALPGSAVGGQDLTGFGDALKSDAFRATIGGGGGGGAGGGADGGGAGGAGGGAGSGVVRAAWMAEMWDEDVPPAFVDCITQEIMQDPVITADGHSYERAAIENWLMHHDTSPMTGKVLPPLHSTPAATAATDAATAADHLQGGSFSPCLAGCSCKHSGSCMGQGRCSAVGSGEGCAESGGEGCSGHCVVDKTLRPNHILRGQIIEFQEMMAMQARERTAAAAPTRAAPAFAT